MIGKFAVSLATMALSATVLVAQTSTTPPTVKPATQVTKTPAQTPRTAKPATTAAKPATAETKAEKKTAEEQKKADKKAAEQKKKAADEQAKQQKKAASVVHEACSQADLHSGSSRQQVGEGPSARQRNWLRYPHLKPRTAPLRAIGGALLLAGTGGIRSGQRPRSTLPSHDKSAACRFREPQRSVMAREGIEPPTRGFSVRCSTN